MNRVGFIGVGVMGLGMASRLLQAGYPVQVVAHRNRQSIEEIVSRGASEARDYAQLAESSDVIILCVSSSTVVEEVINALKPALRPGMIVVDMGTSNPDSSRAIYSALAGVDVSFVEAPVTGGVRQAASGELGALVGAEPGALDAVRPLLESMCRTVHHFGPPGAGNTAKLLNNYMVLGMAALVIEAFDKARSAGIDWQKLYDVVLCGSADSGVLRRIVGSALEGDYTGYVFSVEGSFKDMLYFSKLSESMGGVSEIGKAVTQVYEKAVADGRGNRLLSELLAPESTHENTRENDED
jgi:3-hydroxyisobutyrate dehydrogenase-like beta-hydroxyacid dehydrogenase